MTIPRPEYPRPILVRDQWLNLNGPWSYRADPEDAGLASGWHNALPMDAKEIQVPFPIESEASGIHDLEPPPVNWYARSFEIPPDWIGHVMLRFGAVDHACRVFINGQQVGDHRGGYTPFGFDITHALKPGDNEITLRVEDSLSWTQPRGKQAGTTRWPIDYDSVTGIWQTVWLEPVPPAHIDSTAFAYDASTATLTLTVGFNRQVDGTVSASVLDDGKVIADASAETGLRAESRLTLEIPAPRPWSPADPFLYDIDLRLTHADGGQDDCRSYTGLREVSWQDGTLRLNGEPLYLRGVLDQGYFPKGWYTAPTDDDLRADVELTLAMGLNCARKHQKAEDPRYLYWADRLGLLVWAEMPSGKIFSTELIETVTHEWTALVKRDRAHPSIITWVPFNESWGVWHQASRPAQRAFVDSVTRLTQALDPSRPVVGNDGWEYSDGDLWTLHLYDVGEALASRIDDLLANPTGLVTGEGSPHPRAGALPGANPAHLPILLTECGGVGFGRYSDADFSYGDLPADEDELEAAIRRTAGVLASAAQLQGFVWTQLTDIQQEINGLLYFDRSPKLPLSVLKEIFTGIPGRT